MTIFFRLCFFLILDHYITNQDVLKKIGALLEVALGQELEESLTGRVITAYSEIVWKLHNVDDAVRGHNAFAKALYNWLFSWIIAQVNSTIDQASTDAYVPNSTVIGVLDIYEFDILGKKECDHKVCDNCLKKFILCKTQKNIHNEI